MAQEYKDIDELNDAMNKRAKELGIKKALDSLYSEFSEYVAQIEYTRTMTKESKDANPTFGFSCHVLIRKDHEFCNKAPYILQLGETYKVPDLYSKTSLESKDT